MHFEFHVREKVDGSNITWEAVEKGTGAIIPLPQGGHEAGGENFVGRYPEIEQYLQTKGVTAHLAYSERLEDVHHDRGDGSMWTYKRGGYTIVVKDIHRTRIKTN